MFHHLDKSGSECGQLRERYKLHLIYHAPLSHFQVYFLHLAKTQILHSGPRTRVNLLIAHFVTMIHRAILVCMKTHT